MLQQFLSEISSDLLPRAAASKCLMGLANVSIWAVQLSGKKKEREREMTMKNRGVFFKELAIGNIKDGSRRPIEVTRNRMLAMKPFGFDIRSWTPISISKTSRRIWDPLPLQILLETRFLPFPLVVWGASASAMQTRVYRCHLQVSPLSPSERRVATPHQERDIWQEERHPRDGIRTERPGDSDRGLYHSGQWSIFFSPGPVDNHRNDS